MHCNATTNLINWPQYENHSKKILEILDGAVALNISSDTFRETPLNVAIEVLVKHPL